MNDALPIGTDAVGQQQGLLIAATAKLVKRGASWLVPSQSMEKRKYAVVLNDDGGFCTCSHHADTGRPCKHQVAVTLVIQRELNVDGSEETKVGLRVTYAQQSWAAYNEGQTRERELFTKLMRELCNGIVQPEQGRGRPRLSWADMTFACALKVYRGNSTRRFIGDAEEAHKNGLLAKVPHFNSVINFLNEEAITPALYQMVQLSALPLKAVETNFAIDSTGFSSTQLVGQWKAAKYGEKHLRKQHDWLKVHAMCGVKTNVVTAVEVTESNTGDAPRFRPLLEQTTKHFDVKRVMGDKAYVAYSSFEAAEQLGVEPFIMFKENSIANSNNDAWDRMFHLFSAHRGTFLKAYHLRSNVESTFSAIKRVFGDFVRAKNQTAQINEVLLKIICHNIRQLIFAIFELGIETTFQAAIVVETTEA